MDLALCGYILNLDPEISRNLTNFPNWHWQCNTQYHFHGYNTMTTDIFACKQPVWWHMRLKVCWKLCDSGSGVDETEPGGNVYVRFQVVHSLADAAYSAGTEWTLYYSWWKMFSGQILLATDTSDHVHDSSWVIETKSRLSSSLLLWPIWEISLLMEFMSVSYLKSSTSDQAYFSFVNNYYSIKLVRANVVHIEAIIYDICYIIPCEVAVLLLLCF